MHSLLVGQFLTTPMLRNLATIVDLQMFCVADKLLFWVRAVSSTDVAPSTVV